MILFGNRALPHICHAFQSNFCCYRSLGELITHIPGSTNQTRNPTKSLSQGEPSPAKRALWRQNMRWFYGHADPWARLDYVWIHPRCTSFMISLWNPWNPPIPRDKGVASVVWRMSSCKWSGLLTWVAWPAFQTTGGLVKKHTPKDFDFWCETEGCKIVSSNIPTKAHFNNQKYPPSS